LKHNFYYSYLELQIWHSETLTTFNSRLTARQDLIFKLPRNTRVSQVPSLSAIILLNSFTWVLSLLTHPALSAIIYYEREKCQCYKLVIIKMGASNDFFSLNVHVFCKFFGCFDAFLWKNRQGAWFVNVNDWINFFYFFRDGLADW